MGRELPQVPRNVLEDSTLGVAVRAEVPRLEENGTFEAPNHTRRAEKPQRVERNRSQDHPANVSGKCSSGHQGGAGRCTSSTECEAERFCHQEHSTCEPFCISSYGRSELQMKRCSGCLKSCGARCHGFIEERKALREGSCAKRLLLRSCQQCKEACQELPEEMPIRFPEDEPRVADVWITSYPKAGSTWVRHLITNLHFAVEGQRRPASFKEVDDFIPFIEDGQGWTSRTMFRDRQGLRFWKSHSPFHCDTFPCKGHVVARQGPSQCMPLGCAECAEGLHLEAQQPMVYVRRSRLFEQIGGRCKLVEEDQVRSCSLEEVKAYELRKAEKLREAKEKEQKKQERRARDWKQIQDFLLEHHFAGINDAKSAYFGFQQTYPLHTAAKEQNMMIMNLLLKFGADPRQKDSHGKRAVDYVLKKLKL
ncbi:Sulfotransferase family cytosolic 1B member 1 [Durusdinium trenchii]|uniref:Sulfotransferase family cytosolic 1B member 1 n=1 Tax=Durusdinium trenchii TaxID=1381693 RepID=A0ABP0K0U3_9DINO